MAIKKRKTRKASTPTTGTKAPKAKTKAKTKKKKPEPISPAELKRLGRESKKRRLPMSYKTLTLAEMKEVEQWTAAEGGFQRQLSTKQVNEVTQFLLHSPTPVLPPILLAKLKGSTSRRRWCIDGQHRLRGAVQANVSITAVVITVNDLEQARYLFLMYNSKARKVSKKFIGMVSNNNVAAITRALADEYGAFYEHIKRLGIGLNAGTTTRYWDEVAHDAAIPDGDLKKMRLILNLWTKDPRWNPSSFPEEKPGEVTRCISRKIVDSNRNAYCIPGVLQVVGAVVRDLKATSNRQIKTIVTVAQNDLQFKRKKFRDEAGRNGMDFWCKLVDELKTKVAVHALNDK